jgi:ATPase subunit of ABC transporter with duplicated ATPase domains
VINGELEPEGGRTTRADGRVAYLSQRLDLLDLDRTVAENLAAYAPGMPEAQRMNLLARFLFRAPASTSQSQRCPAASGCAPPWPASGAPNRRPSCCWTNRPTTST